MSNPTTTWGPIDLLGWLGQTYAAGRTRRADRGKCADGRLLSKAAKPLLPGRPQLLKAQPNRSRIPEGRKQLFSGGISRQA